MVEKQLRTQPPLTEELPQDTQGSSATKRLKSLNIELPTPSEPIANYIRFRQVGRVIHLSGQGSMLDNGDGIFGKIGRNLTLADGIKAAHMTAMNMIAQARLICDGDLDRIHQWIKLTGYVNCTDEFTQHPSVLDGATALLEDVFGPAGLASRTAVGVSSLPMNIAVEIQAEFEMKL